MKDFHNENTIGAMGLKDIRQREYISYSASYDECEKLANEMVRKALLIVLDRGDSIYAGNVIMRLEHGETADGLSVTVSWQPDE